MSSRLVHDYLADGIATLRADHTSRHNNQMRLHPSSGSTGLPAHQVAVGGLVRSYTFEYAPNKNAIPGTMTVEFNSRYCEFNATMVILGGSRNDGIAAERIVAETHKISDCSEAVVEAYFSAYCNAIGRYIVVYEPFEAGSFNPPARFLTTDKSNLSDFWRDQVRGFIKALCLARDKWVVHGSLLNADSYVMSEGRVKFINVGRRYGRPQMSPVDDLHDLREYIWDNQAFGAQSCPNWESLHYLLGSKKMEERRGYSPEQDLLQHPVLLKPGDRIVSYAQLAIFMWDELDEAGRTSFANAMYVKMPQYRDLGIHRIFDISTRVYNGILKHEKPHSFIYLHIIQFVRNIIKHANDYNLPLQHWNEAKMCREIEGNLSDGFMGMAYSLSKTRGQDWTDLFQHAPAHLTRYY